MCFLACMCAPCPQIMFSPQQKVPTPSWNSFQPWSVTPLPTPKLRKPLSLAEDSAKLEKHGWYIDDTFDDWWFKSYTIWHAVDVATLNMVHDGTIPGVVGKGKAEKTSKKSMAVDLATCHPLPASPSNRPICMGFSKENKPHKVISDFLSQCPSDVFQLRAFVCDLIAHNLGSKWMEMRISDSSDPEPCRPWLPRS